MALKDVLNALDNFSDDELRELRDQIDQRRRERAALALKQMSPQERIARLETAADKIRAGFTDEEWAQIEHDMNAEYVEPWDESEWRD